MSFPATQKISCLIVDDEEPAHDVLKFLMAKIPWLHYAGSCYNAVEALEVIPRVKPHILFLDVNMPELSGIDLLNIIQSPGLQVIMTTAHPQYALDGFAFDVTSFLLKPIGFDRFLKAVTKARRLIEGNGPPDPRPDVPTPAESNLPEPNSSVESAATEPSGSEEYIWIRADRKMYCVWFKDIYFVEGLKDYVKIYYTDGVLVALSSMSALAGRLPAASFVRTHRSYIVNRDRIKVIEGNTITMQNDMQVTIAASPTRDEVFRQLTRQ